MTCEHGHITPPECLACVVAENERLKAELDGWRNEVAGTASGATRTTILNLIAERDQLRAQIATYYLGLKKAHDAMFNWHSSEYADHPLSHEVGKLLAVDGSELLVELKLLKAEVERWKTAFSHEARVAREGGYIDAD